MVQLKRHRWWLLLLGIGLGHGAAVAQVQQAPRPLQVALCLNDWDRAIALLGPMIGAADISPTQRQALVDYRQRLVGFRDRRISAAELPGCETLLASYRPLRPEFPSPPLDWEGAIAATYGLGTTAPSLGSQALRQQTANNAAGIAFVQDSGIDSLGLVTPLNTPAGSAVSTGAVSNGYEVYSFFGGQGDRVTIRINVTGVYAGSLYTDDDSQLFLFDSQGTLLVDNDDFTGLQSTIADFVLPQSDRYYVAVTTYNNDPILDSDRRITDWSGSGGSNIDFTISVTGLTPIDQLILPR